MVNLMAESSRILIIEDEGDLLAALEREFRHAGMEVFTAQNGVDGLEMALQYQPKVILLDLLLPRIAGMDMLRKLRSYDWGRSVQVVVLTNFEDPSLIHEANELDVAYYLVKANYKLADIVSVVQRLLG